MLTADLVRAVRKKGELKLSRLDDEARARAAELAGTFLEIFRAHTGKTREELEEALEAVELDPRERVLAKGLQKLLEDRSTFESAPVIEPVALRKAVFERAAALRQGLGDDARFDRDAVLAEIASAHATTAEEVERGLFADLRSAQALEKFDAVAPEGLVAEWERGQAQAVLLRAVKVRVEIACASPSSYRALFRRMKFLRLLYTLAPQRLGSGYILEIDGPFSLFDQVTKYGLELAMLYPALESCDRFKLEADVRWGNTREALIFRAEGGTGRTDLSDSGAELPDDVRELMSRIEGAGSRWTVRVAEELLDLPGFGLVVPDLVLTREDGTAVLIEVLGHWSRDAVWRRVELAERGLGKPIVFAVSSRLRVSEEALGDEVPAALYVYKGSISAKALLEKVDLVAALWHARD